MTWFIFAPLLAVFLCALGDLWVHTRDAVGQSQPAGRIWTVFDLVGVIVLIIHQGTRFYVGTDYFTYRQIFDSLIPGAVLANIERVPQEPLYTLISVAVRSFSDDFTLLFLVMSVLAIVPAYHAILNVSNHPSIALSFYLLAGTYLLGFNVVRQAIAIGLVLLVYAWRKKHRFWAVIVGCAAVGIHFAAIAPLACILLYGIARSRTRRFRVASVLVAGVVAVILLRLSTGSLTLFGFSFVQDRYSSYLDAAGFSVGRALLLGGFVILFACAWGVDSREKFPHWMGLLGIGGMLIGLNYVFIGRISWYFVVFLLVPLAGRSRGEWSWIFRAGALLGAALIYFASIWKSIDLLPYSSWLFTDD